MCEREKAVICFDPECDFAFVSIHRWLQELHSI